MPAFDWRMRVSRQGFLALPEESHHYVGIVDLLDEGVERLEGDKRGRHIHEPAQLHFGRHENAFRTGNSSNSLKSLDIPRGKKRCIYKKFPKSCREGELSPRRLI